MANAIVSNVEKVYFYDGIKLGTLYCEEYGGKVIRTFEVKIDCSDLESLLGELNPETLLHLNTQELGLYRALQAYDLKVETYVTPAVVALCVMNCGYKTMSQIHQKDRTLWRFVKKYGGLASMLDGDAFHGDDLELMDDDFDDYDLG